MCAVPNTINSWQHKRKKFPIRNSLRAILLVTELISIEYNVGQPDGSTTIYEINVRLINNEMRNECTK
jgi:hypothetical protein